MSKIYVVEYEVGNYWQSNTGTIGYFSSIDRVIAGSRKFVSENYPGSINYEMERCSDNPTSLKFRITFNNVTISTYEYEIDEYLPYSPSVRVRKRRK